MWVSVSLGIGIPRMCAKLLTEDSTVGFQIEYIPQQVFWIVFAISLIEFIAAAYKMGIAFYLVFTMNENIVTH